MHLSLSTPTYPRSGNGWGFVVICKHNCTLLDKYVPSVTFEVKDSPQWMNKSVKNKINMKRKVWIKYKKVSILETI